jgi:hypothetical protein
MVIRGPIGEGPPVGFVAAHDLTQDQGVIMFMINPAADDDGDTEAGGAGEIQDGDDRLTGFGTFGTTLLYSVRACFLVATTISYAVALVSPYLPPQKPGSNV